jgi:alkanesulfonate monooxygenase SsuD/methylene tetrahydromethanopterin reductase-like flavin-dependent oxidoreductase (luciferase family)
MSETRPLGVGITPLETRREVVLRVAVLAEELGYSAFSVAEGWGYDAAVLLTEIATRTTRIELGTGVLNVWGRSPASIAMLAAGLAEVSDGRFTLGLGAGSPQLAEGLHDVPFRAPVGRLAAVARQVRGLLDGERMIAATGAKGLRLAVPPRSRVPLQLAALGPMAIGLCGELADAWMPFLLPMSGLKEGMCLLDEGAAQAGKARPRVRPGIPVAVLPDADAGREVAAWWVAFYLTSMGPLYATTLRARGFGDAVDAVVAANPRGAPPTVPPAAQVLLDELTISGDADAAHATLDRWYAAGAEMPVLVLPPNRSIEELEHILRTLRR